MTSGSPNRRASVAISRLVSGKSSTRVRVGLGALVLAQQIVERFAQERRLLLLLSLRQPLEPAKLRGRVIGGFEHHVVARCEADRVAALLLRREQREVRFAHELVRCGRSTRPGVAWRVGDAHADRALLSAWDDLLQRGVELPPKLFGAGEDRLERRAGREQRELVAADPTQRPTLLRGRLRERRD